MSDWIINGARERQLPIADRGLQYGDGLFETIAIRRGEPRLWHYHLERLEKGCARLQFEMPDPDEILSGIHEAIAASAIDSAHALAKVIVTAGAGRRGYGRQYVTSPTLAIAAYPATLLATGCYTDGVTAALCETRLAGGSPLAGLKTLNRLEQVLARMELQDEAIFEGLTMDADDNIICGTMSNVFFVIDNQISTPPLDSSGVAGVMRRHVIESLSGRGIGVAICHTNAQRLDSIDEIFLSNSQFGILPVSSCGPQSWSVGAVTRNVMAILVDNGVGECQQ